MRALPAPPEPTTTVGGHPFHGQHLSLTASARGGAGQISGGASISLMVLSVFGMLVLVLHVESLFVLWMHVRVLH